MRIRKKDFAEYLGVSIPTALKEYQGYLDLLGYERKYLTVFDIAEVDNLDLITAAQLLNLPTNYINKLKKIKTA